MKNIFVIFISICLFFNLLTAQTTPIANKSHCADAKTIVAATDGGFGNPRRPNPKKIIYLNDSMVVEEKDVWGKGQYLDTIWNHPEYSNPKNTLKKLKKMYPDVRFEGFKERGKICHRPTGKYRKTQLQEKKSAENTPSSAIYWGIVGIITACSWAIYSEKKRNG
jgi:hypothetical protein